MGYTIQSANLNEVFQKIEQRVLKLETASRFTAPNITTAQESAAFAAGSFRAGDIWLNTTTNQLRTLDAVGAIRTITWV